MKRQIQIGAVAAMFDAVKKLDTNPEHVLAQPQRSSGRFGRSTTVRLAVNMDGAKVRLAATWSLVEPEPRSIGLAVSGRGRLSVVVQGVDNGQKHCNANVKESADVTEQPA